MFCYIASLYCPGGDKSRPRQQAVQASDSVCLQIVCYIERVLCAEDDGGAALSMRIDTKNIKLNITNCGIPAVLQIVPYIERVLYAEDDEGAAQAMEDCRQRFTEASTEPAPDDAITNLVGQMSPLRV